MKKRLTVYGKDSKPTLVVSEGSGPVDSLFTFKKFLDERMKGEKPKSFVIEEYYDKNNLVLQQVTVCIKAESGKTTCLPPEIYYPSFMFNYSKKEGEGMLPNSIIYESEVSKDGRVLSRKLRKK